MSDLNDKTDEELLQLSGNKDSVGKREVLSLLLDRHYNWIFKMCLAHLKHTQTAEDCAQEIVIQVAKSLHNFKHQSKFSTWLYTITKRNILKAKVKKFLQFQRETSQEVDVVTEIKLNEDSTLWHDIQRLPEKQKDILVLHYFEDKSIEQIAEQVKISVGTVKSHLFKARNNLKKYIEE